jgi:hypothetical protein
MYLVKPSWVPVANIAAAAPRKALPSIMEGNKTGNIYPV